jgi:hypothetical protein
MDKYCISLLLEFSGFKDCIIKCYPCQYNIQPFASVVLDAVQFQSWSNRRHKNRPSYLKSFTTVSDTLGMITGTGCNDSSFHLLLRETSESASGASDFETTDRLQIFSLQIYISIIFFGKEHRLVASCMCNNLSAFAVGLIDFSSRDKF